jgi:hypothetical protein
MKGYIVKVITDVDPRHEETTAIFATLANSPQEALTQVERLSKQLGWLIVREATPVSEGTAEVLGLIEGQPRRL